MNNLKIQIVGTLNTSVTLDNLNKQLKALEGKLSTMKLKVTIEDGKLNNTVKNMQSLNVASTQTSTALKTTSTQLKQIGNDSDKAAKSTNSLISSFNTALVKYPIWLAATGIFLGIPKIVTNAIDTLVQLDTQLVNLQKVMNADTNFENVMNMANNSAKEFAKTLTETLSAYEEFARSGYNESEIGLMSDAALITSNVGEMTTAKSAEYLTSALIQMKLEAKDAMSVIDGWNNVSNKNA